VCGWGIFRAPPRGIGAALFSPDLFADFITRGALVARFSSKVEGPNCYWMLRTKQCAEAHFLSWMKSQFGIA
jgi:hypothetical protein